MHIETDLLGIVNEASPPSAPLQTKYILRVTAEQLHQWLQFERRGTGKNAAFRISKSSTIQIDPNIQRGRDALGFALQQPKKIIEIADTLLDPRKEAVPRLYLGSLTWNVRPPNSNFHFVKIEVEGKPAKWRLAFDTDAIYLTDSAHRHLGIVLAYTRYMEKAASYPAFDPKFEFSVELYRLDTQRERELFSELNSKQKKISTAKQKEMDVSSPIGALKDAILAYDRGESRLFDQNIEVSSNSNDKHTLITMSVFCASIDAMFTSQAIEDARDNEDVRLELAEYYCQFFYELRDQLVVKSDLADGKPTYHPFRNLYYELIKPVEDAFDSSRPQESESKLQQVREKAAADNKSLRQLDVANHNSFVKALAWLAGHIRLMSGWRNVITRLQQENIEADLKLFQKTNTELFSKEGDADVPIASLNEDKTINVQVQTKTINKIQRYLLRKLHLDRPAEIFTFSDETQEPEALLEGQPKAWQLNADGESYKSIECHFYLPDCAKDFPDGSVRLDVDGKDSWKKATRKGKASGFAPTLCEKDEQYADPHFDDIHRWRAKFEISLPAASSLAGDTATLALKFVYPTFANPEAVTAKGELPREFVITKAQ